MENTLNRLNELLGIKAELKQKIFKLKTKKAQAKVHDQLHVVDRELGLLYMKRAELYDNKVFKAKVVYADNNRGTGLIDIPEISQRVGELEFWSCNSVNTCTWYPETCCVEFEKGQDVEVTLKCEGFCDGLQFTVTKIVGGFQNLEKFNELNKDKKLAFVVLKGQETGLFG